MLYPALPGVWHGLVVVRAGTYFHGHQLADQHIARHLAARGVPVLYVNPPTSAVAARRDPSLRDCYKRPGLRLASSHLAVLNTQAPPGKSRPGMRRVTDHLSIRALRKAVAALVGEGNPSTVRACLSVAQTPVLLGVAGERTSVFWARDDYTAGAALMGLKTSDVAAVEEKTAAKANVVIAVSPVIADRWAARGVRTTVVPNGCDVAGLAGLDDVTPNPEVTLPGPIAGVVGSIGDRIDFDTLDMLAERGHSILIVGGMQRTFDVSRIESFLARENVQYVGHKAASELPSYLAAIDVGLVPYVDSAFNRASFPLKTLEYLAAGRPAISTPLPATSWLATDLVKVAAIGEEYVNAVEAALQNPGGDDARAARRKFAARHEWSHRASSILSHLPWD